MLQDLARRLPRVLAAVGVSAALGAACGGTRSGEIEAAVGRARGHIDMLAGTIGRRPVGSRAAALARAYLVDELTRAGFTVRLQAAESVDPGRGLTVPVVNIIAVKGAERDQAIALVAHYDSAPDAPGALDDALGVAVCLEAGRTLAALPLRHALMIVLTDGEEVGLMGARAAVTDPEIIRRVQAFLNFDGTGAAGPSLLFQARGGGLLRAWAANADAPEGGSFSTEIYRRLPNDTDFTVFAGLGIAGLNFAPVGDSYAYHTDRDVPARVQPFTVRHAIANTISTVQALDRSEAIGGSGEATFFDVAGIAGVTYGSRVATVLAGMAGLLGGVAWLRLTVHMWRSIRTRGMCLAIGWALAAVASAFAASVAMAAALRAMRGEVVPWYASPHWLSIAALAAALAAFLTVRSIAARLAPRLATPATPAATWWLTLPVWIALLFVLHGTAPLAGYLAALPVLVAAPFVLLFGPRARHLRYASAVVAVACAVLWAGDTIRLLQFIVPLFGWLPVVPSVWMTSVLLAAGATFCAPPLAAALAGRSSRAIARAAIAAGVCVAVGLTVAARAPAYTADRPERRSVRYLQQQGSESRAWWEIGGPEARIGVSEDSGPAADAWQPVSSPLPTTVRVPALRAPFVFRASTTPAAPVPAGIRSRLEARADGAIDLLVSITPAEPLAATLVLPERVLPRAASLHGVVVDRRWRATYLAVPPSGITLRTTLDARVAPELASTVVVLSTFTVPGGSDAQGVPAWLRQPAMTWQPRALYVVPAPPEGVPLPPVRTP